MSDRIDKELKAGLYEPPQDFAARVMADIDLCPLPQRQSPIARTSVLVEWVALAGALIAGMSQLLPFLFGVWTVSNAG